jgi:hypothetical protein
MEAILMAIIVIKDLSDSTDLDRQAMLAISGGARSGRPWQALAGLSQDKRIVDYPPGMSRGRTAPAKKAAPVQRGSSK